MGEHLLLGHGEEMGGGRDQADQFGGCFRGGNRCHLLRPGLGSRQGLCRAPAYAAVPKVEQGGILKDYKTILQEVVYQEAQQTVSYELVSTSGPDHDKTFTFNVKITGKVMGTGTGRSKKDAEQKAAKEALAKIAPTR